MRRVWAVMLVLAALILLPPLAAAGPKLDDLLGDLQIIPLEPTPAPAFSGRDLTGVPVTLAEFRGRPVLLYFWATW